MAGELGWAVISLHDYAEQTMVPDLARDFRRHLPGGTFYFPAVQHNCLHPSNPLASYVFLLANRPDRTLLHVERSKFVATVLCVPATRRIVRLTDGDLQRMVEPSRPVLRPGQAVRLLVGDWAGLDGVVVRVAARGVTVRIRLWSRCHEVRVPAVEVQPI